MLLYISEHIFNQPWTWRAMNFSPGRYLDTRMVHKPYVALLSCSLNMKDIDGESEILIKHFVGAVLRLQKNVSLVFFRSINNQTWSVI